MTGDMEKQYCPFCSEQTGPAPNDPLRCRKCGRRTRSEMAETDNDGDKHTMEAEIAGHDVLVTVAENDVPADAKGVLAEIADALAGIANERSGDDDTEDRE